MFDANRLISEEQIVAFERDGAAVVRGVIDPARIDRMRDAIDVVLDDPHAVHQERSVGEGRFYNGFFHWLRQPEFEDLVLRSPLPEVAARFMRARSVNFFYDQLMVKEPGTPVATPWHTDNSYYPISGGNLLSIWVPFDPATPQSGVVSYLRGSHLWDLAPSALLQRLSDLPPPGQDIPEHELITWTLEPGDVLLHHGRTAHGAPGNRSTGRRRALALRWTDQDVRWSPGPEDLWVLFRQKGITPPDPGLSPGDPMTCSLFPQVWRA